MVLFSAFLSLCIAIQDPLFQKFAVRIAGSYLSEKTGAEIKVGRVYISPDLSLHVDQMIVNDLHSNQLANVGYLEVRFSPTDLINRKIHIKNIELRNSQANLIQYEGESDFNFMFLADFFNSGSSKPKKEKPDAIKIDHISLKDFDFQLWIQDHDHPEKAALKTMDYAHIDIDSIFLEADDLLVVGDSIMARIDFLSAYESSGFIIKSMESDVNVSKHGILLDGLMIETNNSNLHLDLHMLYNDYTAFNDFLDSVRFDSKIYPTDIMLSDIGHFADVMYQMPNRVFFECLYTGPVSDFKIDNLSFEYGKETHFEGSMSMCGLPDFMTCYNTLNIDNMAYSYDDLVHFHIPGESVVIPLPKQLEPLQSGNIQGRFKGSYTDFISELFVTSKIGDVGAAIEMKKVGPDNLFSSQIEAKRINIGSLTNAPEKIGTIDLSAQVSGRNTAQGMELDIDGNAYNAFVLGNTIDAISLDGNLSGQRFNGLVSIKDNELDLDFNGMLDFSDSHKPVMNFDAEITKADLKELNIVKGQSKSILSTKINANLNGIDLDVAEGSLSISNTKYSDGNGSYAMDHFDATLVNDQFMQKRFTIGSDLLDFDMAGKINFATLGNAFKSYVVSYADIPQWHSDGYGKINDFSMMPSDDQDFFVNLTLKKPTVITSLLMPNLNIANNTSFKGTFTSKTRQLNFTLRSKSATYNGIRFDNIECKNFSTPFSSVARLSVDDVILRDSAGHSDMFKLQNLGLTARLRNDSIVANLSWFDDMEHPHNKADIKTSFVPEIGGGRFNIAQAEILVNDSLWIVNPFNTIRFADGRTKVSNLAFFGNKQSVSFDGYIPLNQNDTISVAFDRFNISSIDPLLSEKGINLDGFISGKVKASNVTVSPTLFADLRIDQLALNGDRYGDAVIQSVWDNEEKSVYAFASIVDGSSSIFSLAGTYLPTKKNDNLNFQLSLNHLRLDVISPFTQGIIERVQGYGTGKFNLTGSLDRPSIKGKLKIDNGGCKVDFLNTFYTFNPTIQLDDRLISFENLTLHDTLGHSAIVVGEIHHKNLKDFRLDLKLLPDNFLALATTAKENSTFYGTAIADGIVEVKGKTDNISLNITALTKEGTSMTIPLGKATTIKENDYIIFVNSNDTLISSADSVDQGNHKGKKTDGFALNLNLRVTEDANVKILLPNNIGNLETKGAGNIKIGTNASGDFTLFGDYIIHEGELTLNYENLVRKDFTLQSGGRIAWNGDPARGSINATGVYRTKAPLSSLGISDEKASNVNVECLLHLTDVLVNPNITFGLRLPNASEDISQTVFSIIDTTNQAVISQQLISLLVLNSFSHNIASDGMIGSNYFDVLTGQLSSWLSQITREFDVNLHYKPGDNLSNEELQVALKTQLFNDRLTIEGDFGVVRPTSSDNENVSNIVGDFDAHFKLTRNGRLAAHAFRHSNLNTNYYNYTFDMLAPYTIGIGITYRNSFDRFSDIFGKRKRSKTPLINRPVGTVNKKNDTQKTNQQP